jgi:hypothetical protein
VSVLIGAEFNAHLYPKPQRLPNAPVAAAPASPGAPPGKETMVAAGEAHKS